jgi:hypothetical protein
MNSIRNTESIKRENRELRKENEVLRTHLAKLQNKSTMQTGSDTQINSLLELLRMQRIRIETLENGKSIHC